MNQQTTIFENYPFTTPLLENFVWFEVYLLGFVIILLFNIWAAHIYLVYSLVSMYLIIPRYVCTSCSYYGKTCHSGQGRISALFFSKRDPNLFSSNFKYMRFAAPVFLFPLIIGVILIFIHYSFALALLTFAFGMTALCCTRIVTYKLGCPHCNQKSICPGCNKIRIKK